MVIKLVDFGEGFEGEVVGCRIYNIRASRRPRLFDCRNLKLGATTAWKCSYSSSCTSCRDLSVHEPQYLHLLVIKLVDFGDRLKGEVVDVVI